MAPLAPLATVADLANTLGRSEPEQPHEYQRWQSALRDASSEIRRITGQPISAGTAELRLTVDRDGRARIPLCPVRAVRDVTTAEARILDVGEWRLEGQIVQLRWPMFCRPLTATVDYGYPEIPGDIRRLVFALAAAQIAAAARGNLGLTGGVSAISVDDGRLALSDAPIELPLRLQEQLRAQYGGGA